MLRLTRKMTTRTCV
jgi:hypothetical protein